MSRGGGGERVSGGRPHLRLSDPFKPHSLGPLFLLQQQSALLRKEGWKFVDIQDGLYGRGVRVGVHLLGAVARNLLVRGLNKRSRAEKRPEVMLMAATAGEGLEDRVLRSR